MSGGAKSKWTQEEEVLLNSYTPHVSKKSSAFFYVNAAAAAAAPIYLFYGVNHMELTDSWLAWIISFVGAAYLLVNATKNSKHLLKHKIVLRRSEAVAAEIGRKFADDKKMSRKEKEERVLFARNEVAESEATYLAALYTNVLFVSTVLFLAFFLLASTAPWINCIASVVGAAGFVYFLSQSK